MTLRRLVICVERINKLKKIILEFPKGLKVDQTLFPFQQGKMNEARKNLM